LSSDSTSRSRATADVVRRRRLEFKSDGCFGLVRYEANGVVEASGGRGRVIEYVDKTRASISAR